ncbi:glycosyltransferase family 2 protein [Pelagibacterium luteolum]|uniref:Glycosyltransferase, GT2 family n=1 Tax=Pelagibacterium luteolum TaxID=440168 RepID=A0A1G7XXE6_9HYPH|nr:glycosyltransferase family 2 protein [Pelagibacterium luteolum]SDG88410.1 Glycosyltransferase, GT2 family [Pelagibacterium luteolum]
MQLLSRMSALKLSPLGDVEIVEKSARRTSWRFTGSDPSFIVRLRRPLVPGQYRLDLVDPEIETDGLNVKLYLDTGSDFSEVEIVSFRLSENVPYCIFEIERPVHRLRLDPHDAPGALSVGMISLSRLSTPFSKIARVSRAAANRVNSLDDVRRLLGKSYSVLKKDGIVGLRQALGRSLAREAREITGASYAEWVRRYDTFTADEIETMRQMALDLVDPPLISVVMPVYNAPEDLLREAIESVRGQAYQNWQLCIADDASTDRRVRTVLEEFSALDSRIEVVFREQNGHISEASNSALALVKGDWFALLDHDDLLRPNALLEVALEISRHPDAALIYSDEDKIDGKGERYDPFFKPNFSLEMFRAHNYFNHLTVHKTALVRSLGGWRKGYEGSQDYDLNLRVIETQPIAAIRHIPKILYHWRAAAGSTASAGSEKGYAYSAGFRALEDHAKRLGSGARVEEVAGLPFYRYRPHIPQPEPLVSLIIPTRDRFELIKGCVDSILEKTIYSNYEILIVDNGSTDPDTLAYFESLSDESRVRNLSYDHPFNYSAINNYAAGFARGEILGLINNDIEVISPDWLDEMVSFATDPEIGCVGAKLLYANRTLQHGGVILGVGGVAAHSHGATSDLDAGYFGRLAVASNYSAVTAACMLVRKETFEIIGGLNEADLAIAFNDVDFCIRVRDLGLRNVFTPFATLYHLESVSRGAEDTPEKYERFRNEVEYMMKSWRTQLKEDPFYSPNLTISAVNFSLAFPPRVSKLPQTVPVQSSD